MYKKILSFVVSTWLGVMLVSSLLLLVEPSWVGASEGQGSEGKIFRPAKAEIYTPSLTINHPQNGEVLTTTVTTYVVEGVYTPGPSGSTINIGDVVSVSTDGGLSYFQATLRYSGTVIMPGEEGIFSYAWEVPQEDYVSHTLIARGKNGAMVVSESSPITVYVDLVSPTVVTPEVKGGWGSSTLVLSKTSAVNDGWVAAPMLVFTWPVANDGAGIDKYEIVITGTNGFAQAAETEHTRYVIDAVEGVTYYAHVRAKDRSGNWGEYSPGSEGVTPDLTPPTVIITAAKEINGVTPITVKWNAQDEGCGVAYAQFFTRTSLSEAWHRSAEVRDATEGAFVFTPTEPITYYLSVVVGDRLGNEYAWQSPVRVKLVYVYLPVIMRSYPPMPTGSVNIMETYVYNDNVTLSLTATVHNDEVRWTRLRNAGGEWSAWKDFTSTTTYENWILSSGDSGPRKVEVQFKGSLGGVSPVVSDEVYLTWYGDFEKSWDQVVRYWPQGTGTFRGHGAGLAQSIAAYENSQRLLLGSPSYRDGSIPVGYGYVAHRFVIPTQATKISFSYRVHSYDTVYYKKYFDTFEVTVNQMPGDVSDGERDAAGCRDAAKLNPNGVLLVPGNGLAFCGGHLTNSAPQDWDSGWRTVELDMSHFAGQTVTLYMAVWSREYSSPYYDNHGYYNTYVYIDHVHGVYGQ